MIGAPVLDAFLDLFAIQVLFQGVLGELYDLIVGGKAQADQLVLAEPVNLRAPLRRSQGLETQPFFQPDDRS